ncbi:MAG: hypothetical protein QNK82_12655 [Akkermansiaceae bacterium]
MKFLIFILITGMAVALPTIEEARRIMGSQNTSEREKFTLEIWESGKNTLPLLRELAKDEDPEIANRAGFVLRRLRMGLNPESPEELLLLAEAVDMAKPEQRLTVLNELLEHPRGAPVGLVFLNDWATRGGANPERLSALTKLVTEALLEQRGYWKTFFTESLSPRCRGVIIAELARQDLPMKNQMISVLGMSETKEVYEAARSSTAGLNQIAHRSLAHIAVTQGQVSLALQILKDGLEVATDPNLARILAFLEVTSKTPPSAQKGKWARELSLFRARMKEDFSKTLRLVKEIEERPFLQYESSLLSGVFPNPERSKEPHLRGNSTLGDLHTFFDSPPGEPDIEALASAVLIEWSALARTLILLGRPIEASETYNANEKTTSAVDLLWRTGNRNKALEMAQTIFDGIDEKNQIRMRLTLTKLYLESGEKDRAAKAFEPLIFQGIQRDDIRRTALAIGLKILPREQIIPLAINLFAERPYQRAAVIAVFLPYPEKVSIFWYEYFREQDPLLPPSTIFKKVEEFLNGDQTKAREIITDSLKKKTKKNLLPNDSLYQNALYLRLPTSLEIVKKAAWYQFSIRDLLGIIRDKSWPIDSRKKALQTALKINPTDISLRWFDLQLNQNGDLDSLHVLTLGDPGTALRLGGYTGKRETLSMCTGVTNLKNNSSLRCLAILAKSYLEKGETEKAARLFQTVLCGEIAAGNQPATPIKATLENLENLYEARFKLSTREDEKKLWEERLKSIRKND